MISGKYGRRALLFGVGTTAGALVLGTRGQDAATASPPSSTPTASGPLSPTPTSHIPSEATAKTDPFRPVYHYTPASGNLADPNGLIFHQGEYHLFHQQDGTWAHAVSPDMVRWERLGTALEHDALGLAMSGSCVDDGANTSGLVPGGGMVAIYTSTEGGEAQSWPTAPIAAAPGNATTATPSSPMRAARTSATRRSSGTSRPSRG